MANDNKVQVTLEAIDKLTPVMIQALQNMEANSAKMADALDAVSESNKKVGTGAVETSHSTDSQAISFIALKEAAEVVYAAFEKVEAQFERAIEEALEAEKATNRLTGALVSTGQYSGEAAEELTHYSEALMKQSGLSVETTKNIMATGIQMGLSTEKAKELVEASQKLAATTGGDVQSAFQMLQASMAGQTRGLAKVIPQIKEFGSAQLQQGAAIDLVNSMLSAQYNLYQGSFAAGLEKGKSAISEVYKEFGNIIINSPLAKAAVQAFADTMMAVADGLKVAGDWMAKNSDAIMNFAKAAGLALAIWGGFQLAMLAYTTVVPFAIALSGALATSVSLYGVAGTIAANATAALDAGLAILAAPITLTILGVVALTAAFYKWPGLFDVLVGSIKAFIAVAIFPMTAAMAALSYGIGAIVGVFNKEWGSALKGASTTMLEMNANLLKGGAAQAAMGVESIKAGKAVTDSAEASKKSTEEMLQAQSDANAKRLAMEKVYDGFTYGTEAQRKALLGQVQDRDQDLKNFTAYLDAKERLAISKAEEQRMQVAQIEAKVVSGSGGGEDKSAQAQVAIDAEIKKQAMLDVLRQKGILSEEQYNQATLASDQKAATAELAQSLAYAQAKADALGETPAGMAAKLQIQEQQQNLEIAQARDRSAANGATLTQQNAVESKMRATFFQQKMQQQKQFDQTEVQDATAHEKALADLLGNSPAGQQKKLQVADQQFKMQLQQKKIHAQQEGLSQAQIDQMVENETQNNLANMKQMKEKFIEDDMAQNEMLGNNWQVSLDKIALAQEKFGSVMGTLRGVQQTQEYKGTMDGLSNLASLRNSKSKAAFEVGKSAAIAQTTVQTGMAAMEAYSSMAAIPFIGPALGIAAAAAAIAAGVVQVQNISSQQFNPGGQADEGMDSIPSNLNGKSFTLSAGERVVQPAANKDLTNFLNQQKAGVNVPGSGGGVMITLNYQGNMSQDDVKKMADMLIKEIRTRSDRGTPIMNSKGIVDT